MISVVMASYLGWYKGCASDRVRKFHRAVNSFLNQQIGELIVVSDGCDLTISESKDYPISVYKLEKQPTFSGAVRQFGIQKVSFDWICYLDTDDEFADGHLNSIISQISDDVDWVYFDDIVNGEYRLAELKYGGIGTSCIAHKKNTNAVWPDGYGHDWRFIEQLGPRYKKISNTGYIVNHIKKKLDN